MALACIYIYTIVLMLNVTATPAQWVDWWWRAALSLEIHDTRAREIANMVAKADVFIQY